MLYFIIGLVLFIGLVVLHELGHFWMAKRNGVEVEEFGIFFPPRIYKKKTKGGWDFTINLLPLGGFVKLKGEYDADRRPGSFGAASFAGKIKIMLAGVAVNLVTAVVMFTLLALVGIPHVIDNQFTVDSDSHYVSREKIAVTAATVESGSPAGQAGLKTGDVIKEIGVQNEEMVQLKKADDLADFTSKNSGKKITVRYERDGQSRTSDLVLRSDSDIRQAANEGRSIGRLGIGPVGVREQLTIVRSTWSAPVVAVGLTGQFTKLTFHGLGTALKGLGSIIAGIVTGNEKARSNGQVEASSQVGGPVAIFFTLKEGSKLGLRFILLVIALISLTLAIMNILPIPALDGGRMFVMFIARALNKPLTQKIEERVYTAGFLVLISLIILITIVDVRRFF